MYLSRSFAEIRCLSAMMALLALLHAASAAGADTARCGLMSEDTGKRLGNVQDLMAKNQNDEALQALSVLVSRVKNDECELAVVEQFYGYVYLNKEDYRSAIPHFEKSLALKKLPEQAERQVVYTLAQLYAQFEQYDKTISLMEDWFKTAENPPANAYALLANAYAAVQRYREALPYIKKAIEKSEKPREDFYRLWLALHFELKEYKEAAAVLEEMVANWPDNKKYWEQLSGVYLELDDDKKALATLAIAYRRGMVTDEKQLLNLARMYILNDAPYEAGQIVAKGIADGQIAKTEKNYALLAEAWLQAREWDEALDALGKGGALAADGELYIRKAQLHLQLAQWKEAMDAVDKALQKGKLKKPGQAYVAQGMAAVESKNLEAAENAFRKALGFDDTRKLASDWLRYIEERKQELASR